MQKICCHQEMGVKIDKEKYPDLARESGIQVAGLILFSREARVSNQ